MGLADSNPSSRPIGDEERLTLIGRWALDTCLLFGTTFETAAAVAEHFVRGLRRAWKMA
jgi:hypothetical protein